MPLRYLVVHLQEDFIADDGWGDGEERRRKSTADYRRNERAVSAGYRRRDTPASRETINYDRRDSPMRYDRQYDRRTQELEPLHGDRDRRRLEPRRTVDSDFGNSLSKRRNDDTFHDKSILPLAPLRENRYSSPALSYDNRHWDTNNYRHHNERWGDHGYSYDDMSRVVDRARERDRLDRDRLGPLDAEIVEITGILVDPQDRNARIVDGLREHQFQAYVRPMSKRRVDQRFQDRTGIKQYYLDQAQDWHRVLQQMDNWLYDQRIRDLTLIVENAERFEYLMRNQSELTHVAWPKWARGRPVDLRRAVRDTYYDSGSLQSLTVEKMIRLAGLDYEGSTTSSRNLAFNMALVVVRLLRRGKRLD